VDGYLPILLVFTISVALWMVAMAIVVRNASSNEIGKLESQAREIRQQLEDRLSDFSVGMYAMRSHILTNDPVTKESWESFYRSMDYTTHYPGAWGFSYVRRVGASDVDTYIQQMRDNGYPEFTIRQHVKANLNDLNLDQYVISFHGPESANQSIVGINVGSYDVNRDVYTHATDSGQLSVSPPFQLLQNNSTERSVILALPIFKTGMETETTEQRREATIGWIALPVDFKQLVQLELGEMSKKVGFSIQEINERGVLDGMLYTSIPEDADPAMSAQLNATIVDRDYRLQVVPLKAQNLLLASRSAVLVFVTGALVTLLFSTITWSLTRTRRKAVELARDMTSSIRKSEQRQRVLAIQATSASKAKSDFLANMSHEIRTPMTAILGYADVLGDLDYLQEQSDQFSEAVDSIQRSGKHLMMIINDVLDLSKIESGKLNVDMGAFNILEIVREIYSTMRMNAESKGLEFNVEFGTPFPDRIIGDAYRIRQVLINLVGNAIKFTDSGSVRIVLKENEDQLLFSVVDTGIGIEKNGIDQLFKPFEQLDSSRARKHEGTGLGLTISQHLADLMGGEIAVESTPGEGTVFSLVIPRASELDSTQVTSLDVEPLNSKPIDSSIKVNETGMVLLAEDGMDNQRLISHLLRRVGYEVEIASNGQEAIDMHRLGPDRYDAILMDMQMPVVDGYAATRKLRELGCSLPIIALTAHALQGSRHECIDAGCDEYLSKPIDRERLYQILRKYVSVQNKAA
jgi:signal transduction histidine kinase/CheY-like chemotaxis protein